MEREGGGVKATPETIETLEAENDEKVFLEVIRLLMTLDKSDRRRIIEAVRAFFA